MKIKNAFGLGGDIMDIKLDTPLIYKTFNTGYQRVAQLTIGPEQNYNKIFNCPHRLSGNIFSCTKTTPNLIIFF